MGKPDPSLIAKTVRPEVAHAYEIASKALTSLGIRHVVVGGLAVIANGYARLTKDVDFLVGEEAFEQHPGGFVTMRPGVPIEVGGVAIDLLSATEPYLREALDAPPGSIAEAPMLIYLKLKSPRQKDRADIVELVKAGIDVDACRASLQAHAQQYLAAFESAVSQAAREE